MTEDDSTSNQPERSFQERLSAARQRRGLDPKPPPPGQRDHDAANVSALGIGLRVGVELVSALIVGVAIGWGLDRLLGTRPIFIAVFVLLGGAAGVLNVWRIFAPAGSKMGPFGTRGRK
jgi:ATP synthase protein I